MTATELCVELKDKSAIAQAFGKAAAHYDQHAAFSARCRIAFTAKNAQLSEGAASIGSRLWYRLFFSPATRAGSASGVRRYLSCHA
ncbi:biotin synthesis protein BioC [Vibrio cholerae]|nr:biotin synthesis protein BioC [Vibrio cholerae]